MKPVSAGREDLLRSNQPWVVGRHAEPQHEPRSLTLSIDSMSRSAIEKSLVLQMGDLGKKSCQKFLDRYC